jgi:hypothetical protein
MKTLAASGKYRPPIASDGQLRKGVGQIVNVSYGAQWSSILKKLRDDPTKYGTNWGTPENLDSLLKEGAKIDQAIEIVGRMKEEYLRTAHALADAAHKRDAFGGVVFRDPFDGAPARWHQPLTELKVLHHGAVPLTIAAPVGKPNADGVYPANYFGTPRSRRGSIQNLIAPALIHALDASFASHVILKLRDIGVQDIVAINDCFLVPSDAELALYEAVRAAGEPWFRDLGPFYEVFEDYLGEDEEHGPTVRRWKKNWEDRRAAADAGAPDWPHFRFKPEITYSLEVEGL